MDNRVEDGKKIRGSLKSLGYFYLSYRNDFYYNPFIFVKSLFWYFKDFIKFRNSKNNREARATICLLQPQLADKTSKTNIEPIYYLQDAWAAQLIFKAAPKRHVDIASSIKTMSIISQQIPTTFVDIRPPTIILPNMKYIKGSILKLPFRNNSIESLSALCVLEHIGLGRYGDNIDPFGTEKAIKEIDRVLRRYGDLYVSIPVDNENKVYFNAHRAFTRRYFLSLLRGYKLIEERYIYGRKIYRKYDKGRGFGTGLYHLQKT